MSRENPARPMDFSGLPPPRTEPLGVAFSRGMAIESIHKVHLCIANEKGTIQEAWGNPNYGFFPRSSIKLVQAMLWSDPETAGQFGLSDQEIALSCGSHWAEPEHLVVLEPWFKRLGLKEDQLECGPHEPYSSKTFRTVIRSGREPGRIHNNCSGKHLGLLTRCLAKGYELKGYSNSNHPVQMELMSLLSALLEGDFSRRAWGIDGCGIPTYHTRLSELGALAGRLSGAKNLDGHEEAWRRIVQSVSAFPDLIGGSESYCSQVIRETGGNGIVKVGAEGVYLGLLRREKIGFALKVEDGASRAAEVALSALLDYCGYRSVPDAAQVKNWAGEIVGSASVS